MEIKTKQWSVGSGSATIQYDGKGDGNIIITSDANSLYEARSMQITIETTNGSPKQTKIITINQAAKQRIDLSAAVVSASNQTYSGSAKTPTPTVTLNGSAVPSSGYDVAYSNNTNAGTATITITGKGDYTGTASGTFTIVKASRTLSFDDRYMVLNTSSTGTKTAAPSAGSGDGAITYSIANTTYATINSSSGKVTSKTSDGSVTVTATIAEGSNYLGATATYTLYVFATTHNYSYSGSAKNLTLPPGTYQFQCWGAQGASCSDGYSGGKGGYSVGQLSIANALAIQVLVGGQNGYNGGGSSSGSASYNSGNTYGRSSMGNGGGATDIRLSDGALLSRMIVAGGGSGGAYCRREVTTEVEKTRTVTNNSSNNGTLGYDNGWRSLFIINTIEGRHYDLSVNIGTIETAWYSDAGVFISNPSSFIAARTSTVYVSVRHNNGPNTTINLYSGWPSFDGTYYTTKATEVDYKLNSSTAWQILPTDIAPAYGKSLTGGEKFVWKNSNYLWNGSSLYEAICYWNCTETYEETYIDTETDVTDEYQTGYAGGGTTGLGYNNTYKGKQNGAGSGGSFGHGANQTATGYRYCSGAGGGGWYGGGGGKYSNSDMSYVHYSGGGSGWVNIAANAGNRPSGYTGKQLDSGTTYAGNTSFVGPGGGNETGHSGNGYARITRIS